MFVADFLSMAKTNTPLYLGCITVLIVIFCYHNYSIYANEGISGTSPLTQKPVQGQRLWQENNCIACHQLYGLGGYLGPDLTNVYSHPGKGPGFIKAMLNSGIKTMPKFNFSETEKDAITTYLNEVDQSGQYPNHEATFEYTGWVKIEYRNEK